MDEQAELIPMELGDLLILAREQKGLALKAIAQAVKIRPEILASIESGETGHIPSVYLKGYLRTYSGYLGIPMSVVEQHVLKAKGAEPSVQSIFKEGPPRNRGDRWIKSSSYVLASAVVIALVWQFTTEAVRFSQGDPLLRPAQGLDSRPNSPATSGAPENQSRLPGNSATPMPAKSHLRASIASMSSTADQGSSPRQGVAEGAWAAFGNGDLVTDNEPVIPTGPVVLAITTSADSWVEIIDGNGAKIEMDLLRAGSRRDYNGTGPFRMLLGRASSVELFHNGEKVDLAPYTRGNVARLTLGAADATGDVEPDVQTEPDA